MTSDQTKHTAQWSQHAAADGEGAWVVSWLPGRRLLTRDQAITAMTLAEMVAAEDSPADRSVVVARRGTRRRTVGRYASGYGHTSAANVSRPVTPNALAAIPEQP